MMETIKNYLENMFKALPKTQEVLKLKAELLSNMEEKYNELKSQGKTENEAVGTVIAEFGNIDELINEMGINITDNTQKLPEVTLEEAENFISIKNKTSLPIGIGVVMCILSAAVLILLSGLIEQHLIFQSLSKNAQDILPVTCLLLMIVPAVALFIIFGTKLDKYKYIENGDFHISLATKTILSERRQAISSTNKIAVIIGVCLCVMSPIAIFVGSIFGDSGSIYGVCVLLLIIAAAVFIFIRFGSSEDSYKKLLQMEEYNPVERKNGKVIGAVASVVWPLTTCAFLLWGFMYNGWFICWILFPIVGILFGSFCSIYSTLKRGEK